MVRSTYLLKSWLLFYLQVKLLAMCRMALLCWWPKSGLAQVAGGDLILCSFSAGQLRHQATLKGLANTRHHQPDRPKAADRAEVERGS